MRKLSVKQPGTLYGTQPEHYTSHQSVNMGQKKLYGHKPTNPGFTAPRALQKDNALLVLPKPPQIRADQTTLHCEQLTLHCKHTLSGRVQYVRASEDLSGSFCYLP